MVNRHKGIKLAVDFAAATLARQHYRVQADCSLPRIQAVCDNWTPHSMNDVRVGLSLSDSPTMLK